MLGKASLIAIVAGSVAYWLLEGLWMGVIMADHYKEAFAIFEPVMNASEPSPALWLVSTTLWAVVLMFVGRRGTVSVSSMATIGAILFGVVTFNMEFMMNMWFANYPFMPTSLVSVVWETVAGGITGAVMGLTYSKLNG